MDIQIKQKQIGDVQISDDQKPMERLLASLKHCIQ